MTGEPTPEQHHELLADCWEIARELPTSGVLDRGRRPYRAIRFERKLESVRHDPAGLLAYIRGMARRTSDGLEALVLYDRIDLSVEQRLILDEGKPYADLFTADDRDAAARKLEDWGAQIDSLANDRAAQVHEETSRREARIAAIEESLPDELQALRAAGASATEPEDMIAIGRAILRLDPTDVASLNRLGRGLEAVGWDDAACDAFERALAIDPANRIARRRLDSLRSGG